MQRLDVVIPVRMYHGGARAAVAQPILERFRPEQDRERQRNRAELVDREVRDHGFDRLRQHDRDPVAALDTARTQRIGEPVRHGLELAEAVTGALARRVFIEYRDAIRVLLMALAHPFGDVQPRWDRPAKPGTNPVEIACRGINQSHFAGELLKNS